MQIYHIKTGSYYLDAEHWAGTGYSGAGKTLEEGRNNINMIRVAGKGPIVPGIFKIGEPRNSDRLGPVVMNLDPVEGTDTFGRSLFRIHGDNARNDASHGCIILSRAIRDLIAAAVMRGDNLLTVTAE